VKLCILPSLKTTVVFRNNKRLKVKEEITSEKLTKTTIYEDALKNTIKIMK
jgi:hypothetical protein